MLCDGPQICGEFSCGLSVSLLWWMLYHNLTSDKMMMWKAVSKPDSSWRNEKCDGYPVLIWVSKNIYCTLQLFARAIGFTPKDMTFNYDDQKISDQSWKFHFMFSTFSGLKYPEIHRIQELKILRIIKSWGQTIFKSWGLRILNPKFQDIQSWALGLNNPWIQDPKILES